MEITKNETELCQETRAHQGRGRTRLILSHAAATPRQGQRLRDARSQRQTMQRRWGRGSMTPRLGAVQRRLGTEAL
jgi:hypothetical protein